VRQERTDHVELRTDIQTDIEKLRSFTADILAEQHRNHPDLLDPVHGERNSIGPDDYLVPEALEMRAEIRERSVNAGYYGAFMPADAGGAGWNQSTCVRAYEALAKFPAYPQPLWLDMSIFVTGQAWGPVPVLLNGSDYIRRHYLDALMSGQLTSCTAITDPRAGSDPHNMFATAERTGDGFVLNGIKQFVGNAPYADVTLFYARTSGERGSHRGISLFVLDKEIPGKQTSRIFPVMEGRGNHGEITLENCEVPENHLVGEEGQGFFYLMSFINSGRLLLGALSLGGAQWCLDQAIDRLSSRSTFGTKLSERQGLRWRVAEVTAQVVSLRSTLYEAAAKMDRGEGARTETAVAKLLGPRVYHAAADLAIQAYGGQGFMADHGLERHYRRARGMRIYMGTDEMQLDTIAKAQLRG
jgi:acyl-CoA dehydrogenase